MPLYLVPLLTVAAMLLVSILETLLARWRRPRIFEAPADDFPRTREALTRAGSSEALRRRAGQ